jgi:uncharacterized repeat protein (TIGR03803 family)
MSFLYQDRYALGVVAAVSILTGCGGSQPPIGTGDTTQQATTVRTIVAPARRTRNPGFLYSFTGSPDGGDPQSSVVASVDHPASDPFLVGTTSRGGDANNDGTVYGVTESKEGVWTESVVYTFQGATYSDGSEPTGIVERSQDAPDAFVTTAAGGLYGAGAVVGLTATSSGPWTENVLYSFGPSPDGQRPYGPVVADKAGSLYGTTSAGGKYSAGTVYRMQPKGSSYSETVLYSFEGGSDGANPYAGLTIDVKGALYGTTVEGGSAGDGTVFKLTPSGSSYKESILYSFQGPPNDGSQPYAACAAEADKHIFCNGVTEAGGSQNLGTVSELVSAGSGFKEKVLWSFGSVSGDGTEPYGGVCTDKKGVIYGTTYAGGAAGPSGLGTFFTLTPSASTYKESVYSYTGANGANPYAGPSIDKKGNVYVTTTAGGASNDGTVGKPVKHTATTADCPNT